MAIVNEQGMNQILQQMKQRIEPTTSSTVSLGSIQAAGQLYTTYGNRPPAQFNGITGIVNNTPTEPAEETNTMASQERRSKPETMQFRDLVVGDEVTHNGRPLRVVSVDGAEGFLHYTDQAGGQATWDATSGDKLSTANVGIIRLAGTAVIGKNKVTFDSVILADDKKQQIIDAISQVDHHRLIFETWGFAETFEKGTAISLLFYGPPGTGKTLMAQAIADKYKRQLVTIGSAEISTPEPGGAERNLQKYFAEAQKENQVLLLDECDSLITDRTRVGKIVASEINALLTELERYTGIVILTTNRLGSLDPALDRRLSLKLEFELPDAAERLRIWQRMFPKKAPLAKDIRWIDLAQIEIAGGHIKNVVLKAARKAAAAGHSEITDAVLWECLENEIASQSDFTEALDHYNPWYGTPLQGGQNHGGMTVSPTRVAKVIRERGKQVVAND